VLLGAPVPTHLAQLSRAFVPVEQLVSTARTAKIWDTEAGHTFYAESWALVHYLVRGTPARGARITRFLQRLAEGEDEAAAFQRAIGPPGVVDAELRRYIRPPRHRSRPAGSSVSRQWPVVSGWFVMHVPRAGVRLAVGDLRRAAAGRGAGSDRPKISVRSPSVSA